MMTLAGYYLIICILFLGIAVYNAIFYSEYSSDKCVISTVVDSGTTTTTQQTQSSIQLTKIPLGLTIAYGILIAFVLLGVCGIKKFQGMNPDRFRKLGCCLGTLGCFVRNFTLMLRFMHLIIGIIIIVQFLLLYGTEDCLNAKHYSVSNITGEAGLMQTQGEITNIVTGIAWVVLHFICPCFKKCIEEQSYLYEPFDSDKSFIRTFCCNFLGP